MRAAADLGLALAPPAAVPTLLTLRALSVLRLGGAAAPPAAAAAPAAVPLRLLRLVERPRLEGTLGFLSSGRGGGAVVGVDERWVISSRKSRTLWASLALAPAVDEPWAGGAAAEGRGPEVDEPRAEWFEVERGRVDEDEGGGLAGAGAFE